MKSNSNVKPPILLDLGDGSWYYNYNIKVVEVENEDGTKGTAYDYDTVHIWGTPNYDKCVEAVLRSERSETEEFGLINKYNAYKLGITNNPEDEAEYIAYLTEVVNVKAMVRAELRTFYGE